MRIKKVSQTTTTQAQISDGYSESKIDGYSCDYVNRLFNKDNGYYEFPNGLVICWGEVNSNDMATDSGMGGYSKTVQLPITYSSIPVAIQGFRYASVLTRTSVKKITTSSITLGCEVKVNGIYVPYIVIGYK